MTRKKLILVNYVHKQRDKLVHSGAHSSSKVASMTYDTRRTILHRTIQCTPQYVSDALRRFPDLVYDV